VTIATGRRFRDALPVAYQLNLNAPVICHNGAFNQICRFARNRCRSPCSKIKTVREILRVGKEFGGDAVLSADPNSKGVLLYDTVSDENVPLQKYIAGRSVCTARSRRSRSSRRNLEAVCDDFETVHVSFSGACAPMAHLEMILRDKLNSSVMILTTVYSKLDFTLIDVLPPDASKGIGVEKLALINSISAENVMAIGDNFNDLEMLEYAGTSVVMGNALPELLEREDFFQTLSNDENGVALAIEKFILGDFNGK
jgi:hydroxymethylpyrimidine pyrophosphatase-like HAD family hydrolase